MNKNSIYHGLTRIRRQWILLPVLLVMAFLPQQIQAQNCNILSVVDTIPSEPAPVDSIAQLKESDIYGLLPPLCNPGNDRLFMVYEVIGGMDTIRINENTELVYISCQPGPFVADTVSSGETVQFIAATNRADLRDGLGNNASVNVVMFATEDTPPTYAPLATPVVDLTCADDTTAYLGVLNGIPTNVDDACSGVVDTQYTEVVETGFMADTVMKITRTWVFVDAQGNATAPAMQEVYVMDDVSPFWADPLVDISGYELTGDPTPNDPEDSLVWRNDRRLDVYLDANHPNYDNAYAYWTGTYIPTLVDTCLGVIDTLDVSMIVERLPLTAADTVFYDCVTGNNIGPSVSGIFPAMEPVENTVSGIKREFRGMDLYGNMVDFNGSVGNSQFNLVIFTVDYDTPPEVVDTPLVHLNIDRIDGGMNADTFNLVVDMGSCGVFVDSTDIRITATDSVSGMNVTYSWRLDTLGGGMLDMDNTNNAERTYFEGGYELTYFFEDECGNIDSLALVIMVETVPTQLVEEPTAADFNSPMSGDGSSLASPFIQFNDAGLCGVMLDPADSLLAIVAVDTFDNDGMEYRWRIDTLLQGTIKYDSLYSNGDMDFADSLNQVAGYIPPGTYRVTYYYQDTSMCPVLDSVAYYFSVVDTSGGNHIYRPDWTGAGDTVTVDAVIGQCFQEVTWTEPDTTDFVNCAGFNFGNVTIQRFIVSGPEFDVFDGEIPVMDNLGESVDVQFPVGTTVFRYVFEDGFGAKDSIDLTVIVTDTEDPMAICQNFTMNLDADGVDTLTVMDINAGSNDNCAIDTMYFSAASTTIFDCSHLGENTVELIVADAAGNVDTCMGIVTVSDNIDPVLGNCPADTTFYLDGSCQVVMPDYRGSVTVTDNTDCTVTITQTPAPGTIYTNPTNSNITITATDTAGNSVQCVTAFVVADSTLPVVTCPAPGTLYLNANCQVTVPDLSANLNAATDACGTIIATNQTPAANTVLSLPIDSVLSVALSATDTFRNVGGCTVNYTIADTTAPQAICPGTLSIAPDPLTCMVTMPDFTINSTDNCGIASSTQEPAAGVMIGNDTMVKIVVTDGAGLKDSCEFLLTIQDLPPRPLVNPLPDITTQCDSVVVFAPRAVDNCMDTIYGVPSFGILRSTSPPSYLMLLGSGSSIEWTYTDGNDNDSTQTQNLNFIGDTTPPVIATTSASVQVYLDSTGMIALTADLLGTSATDNCSPVDSLVMTTDIAAAICDSVGATAFPVKVYYTDLSDNTDSTTITVEVFDTLAPVIVMSSDTVQIFLDSMGNVTFTATNLGLSATDNCTDANSIVVTTSLASVDCDSFGQPAFPVTAYFADEYSNTDSAMVFVEIMDSRIVEYTGTDSFMVDAIDNNCFQSITWIEPGLSDFSPCPDAVFAPTTIERFVVSGPDFDVFDGEPGIETNFGQEIDVDFPVGTTVVRYTFEDSLRVRDSIDLTFVVTDTEDPTAICQNYVVNLDATGTYTLSPMDINAGSTDNCSIDTMYISSTSNSVFDCTNLGTNMVWLVVEDPSGNIDSCQAMVTVADNMDPVLIGCPADTTFYFDTNCQVVLPDFGVTATDNTDDECTVTVTQSPAAGTVYSTQVTRLVTFTATDAAGNTAQCTATFTVADSTKPVITCPVDDTLYMNNNCGVVIPDLTDSLDAATDNCGTIVSKSQTPTPNTLLNLPIGASVNVVLSVADSYGNTSSCTVTYIVIDTLAPRAVCPTSQSVIPDPFTCEAVLPDFTVNSTDNCGIASRVQVPAAGTAITRDTMVKLVITDLAGLTDSCEFMVTIGDVPPSPLVNPLPDTSTQCLSIVLSAPMALDNCTDTLYGVPLAGGNRLMTNPPSYEFTATNNLVVTWLYVAQNGMNVTQVQNITFAADTTPPVITAPMDTVMIALDSLGEVNFIETMLASATDNCSPMDSLIITTSPAMAGCDSVGQDAFPITIYATDERGNIDSVTTMVEIVDNRPPDFIGLPPNDTLSCTDEIPVLPTITIRDNCTAAVDSVVIDTINTRVDTNSRNVGYYNYYVTYSWTATDDAGNSALGFVRYDFMDTEAPVIPYANPLRVGSAPDATSCTASVTLNLLEDITDNCSDTVYIAVDFLDGNGFIDTTMATLTLPMGRDSIVIRARDIVGNTALDTLVIEVDDRTPPRPVCVNAISVTINPLGYVAIDSSDINMNSSDNCTARGNLRYSLSRDTFRCEDVGQTFTVVMTVTDEAGNFAGCSSEVTIQDFSVSGAFGCPSDTAVDCSTDISPEVLGFPTVSDVCGENTLSFEDDTLSNTSGNCLTIERTWTATDTFGNPTVCVQMIELVDTILPVFAATYADEIVNCIANVTTADTIGVTDNCAASYNSVAMDSIRCVNDTIYFRRIWSADDGCNEVLDTQLIRVIDQIAPSMDSLPDTLIYSTAEAFPDSCGVFVTIDFANYISDCNQQFGLTVNHSNNDSTSVLSDYLEVGIHTITVTAVDACDNQATKDVVFWIQDNSSPTVVCIENLEVSLGQGGVGTLLVSDVLVRIQDNCNDFASADTAFLSQSTFDCSDLGLNEVMLTVVDSSGNRGTCMISVMVESQAGASIIDVETGVSHETVAGANDGVAYIAVSGGSGTYTVQWDDPDNSTTDTISGLAPGLYSVVVNDAAQGCRLTDTVRVNGGGMVMYAVGDKAGLPGDIIQVPIVVTNFTNVASIDMAFDLGDANVAVFVEEDPAAEFGSPGITDQSFTYVSPTRLLLSATPDPAMGVTLPDGTTIFYINVALTGTEGAATVMGISGNSNAMIETIIISNGASVSVDAIANTGTINVVDSTQALTFGGWVRRENGANVEGVNVDMTGTTSASTETDTSGNYAFEVTASESVTVRPKETRNPRQGLSVSDLVAIQQHILRQDTLDSPYKLLAADVTRNGRISVSDLVDIQAVLLSQLPNFPSVDSWIFVDANYVFENPMEPWLDNYPDSISSIGSNANFIAIKSGDVDLSATSVSFAGTQAENRSGEALQLKVKDRRLTKGELVEVPVRATNFTDIHAWQMTLGLDPALLTLEAVESGKLDNLSINNFGQTFAMRGEYPAVWYQAAPVTVEAEEVLFTLYFRAGEDDVYLSEAMNIHSAQLRTEAHTADGLIRNIQLEFDQVQDEQFGYALYQNTPNPFKDETVIGFDLPTDTEVTLKFFDFSGRQIYQINQEYAAGRQQVIVNRSVLGVATGALYYELTTPDFTARRKMILIE